MEPDTFLDEFAADEGRSGLELALDFVEDNPSGVVQAGFNVWYLYLDEDRTRIRFDHDFDPDEGELPLAYFLDGVRRRLAALL